MQIIAWGFFIGLVALILAFDLGVVNRRAQAIGAKQALSFTLFLMILAATFSIPLYFFYEYRIWDFGQFTRHTPTGPIVERIHGSDAVWQFLAAYLLELSLSADNVFVMAVIFKTFRVPPAYQHRVLLWGIIGALLLRGVMIGLGIAAVRYLFWAMYAFGAVLIFTGVKTLMFNDHSEPHPEGNLVVRWARKIFLVSDRIDGEHFFTKVERIEPDGTTTLRTAATPLFLALLVIETSDVIFAVDSIPAVFGTTHDPFIVFTSNIFAILGLRSLYFAVASLLLVFRYLKVSLGVLLVYIGVKMIVTHYFNWHLPALYSFAPIVLILGAGVAASLIAGPGPKPPDMPSAFDLSLTEPALPTIPTTPPSLDGDGENDRTAKV